MNWDPRVCQLPTERHLLYGMLNQPSPLLQSYPTPPAGFIGSQPSRPGLSALTLSVLRPWQTRQRHLAQQQQAARVAAQAQVRAGLQPRELAAFLLDACRFSAHGPSQRRLPACTAYANWKMQGFLPSHTSLHGTAHTQHPTAVL